MSIIIRGWNKPNSCDNCEFKTPDTIYFSESSVCGVFASPDLADFWERFQHENVIERYTINDTSKVPDWCPIEEARTGHWDYRMTMISDREHPFYSCSVCSYLTEEPGEICPVCGADMEEEEGIG